MPEERDSHKRHEAIKIQPWARWAAGLLGLTGVGSGGAAVFLTHVEAGPVALIAGGVLFLFMSLSGVMPTRVKIGDNEAEWQREVEQSVAIIERRVPEVSAALNSSGASLEALLSGSISEVGPNLAQAGVKVGSLAEDVRFLENKAGLDAVPQEALHEIGRWYLAQEDWQKASRYLEAYTRRAGDADWEVYFSLGVAFANMRMGERIDRQALRAYDEATMRLPPDPPANLTARLYSYRSAIKKRLGRLREAKADATLAAELAKGEYEKADAIYNLAAIEAMLGNREAALRHIKELSHLGATELVLGHANDYFISLLDDPEFRYLVGLSDTNL